MLIFELPQTDNSKSAGCLQHNTDYVVNVKEKK